MASLTQWTSVWATPEDGEGQGSLVCCSSWGHKELDTTEQLNKNKIRESSIKRLQLIKHLENNKYSLEEDSQKTARYV